MAAFRKGLSEIGFVEGRNVAIEYRWAENNSNGCPELAAELVRRNVAVIIQRSARDLAAAKAATQTIPIIFTLGTDLFKAGLVASLKTAGRQPQRASTAMTSELGTKAAGAAD